MASSMALMIDFLGGGKMTVTRGMGFANRLLTEAEVGVICEQAVADWHPAGKRLLLVIPITRAVGRSM